MTRNILFLSLALACYGAGVSANNVTITNVTLQPQLGSELAIEMDLSWENSWRDEFNHDAVWLFVKFSTDQGEIWQHATLQGTGVNPLGYTPGSDSDLEIVVPPDGVGAFVQRAVSGNGHVSTAGLRLRWDPRADGVDGDAFGRISVHALEMVYIPEAPFYVGDDSSFRKFRVTYINSPNPALLTATSGNGTLANPYANLESGMGRPQGVTGAFDPGYPNGYNAFYLMKYDLSRAQYLTFLNMLTAAQASNLLTVQSSFRGTSSVITGAHPNLSNAQPWRGHTFGAVNSHDPSYSGWREHLAYADWAGLRPITEMEFEKAARGPLLPLDRDYPWGTASRMVVGQYRDNNTETESPADSNANIMAQSGYSWPLNYPMRPGAMADAETDQIQAGASYYGVMDLAGNVGKWTIASSPAGPGALREEARNFSGLNGDGTLNADGTHTIAGWTMPSSVLYSGGPVGTRGGGAGYTAMQATVADRGMSGTVHYSHDRGIRAARTAP